MKLPSIYEPAQYEADIYGLWEQSGAFLPEIRGRDDYFSMVLPPPNANGDLHMGHALTVAIEDTLVRYHRMQGRATLYVPGADHAGFETWVVYEKKLEEQGKSRFDFPRDELYRQVWDFVQLNKHNFEAQLRALGVSTDWTRFTFTLDNKVVATSYNTFKKLWDDGLVYRGERIVNFCTSHGTSFSDIEVVHEEEKTKLWRIAYPLADGSGEVVIATARPETKLGQAALMVNPKDERYKHLVGKEVRQPLVPDKPIKIIADEYVDMNFGTGVVTVTPGHDPNDFKVAQRHDLPIWELITSEGKMSENVPQQFRGLRVVEARQAVAEALEKGGFLRGSEDYIHSVGKCYKCGTPIEPLLREQWFVKMRPLADRAIKALEEGQINFYPAGKHSQTIRYLTEVKDWNISRQIAWGMPIPAFQNVDDPKDWIFNTQVSSETIEAGGKTYRRDPDVFDTWFSSGQWPYVTLDYPGGEDFKQFYPLSLMETGGEILYQWVARMIMLGLYCTNQVPFKAVYIHGYVMAEDGRKMSKSLGNVINPLEVIGQYGSDALRMGLLTGRRAGVNQGYHPAKLKAARNFSNKLWNIARYAEDKIGDQHSLKAEAKAETPADHWLLGRLQAASSEMSKALENYRLSEAYEALYHFVWHDFADWYVEASKVRLNAPMLAYGLDMALKLAHPFAPFLTETIWQTLAWEKDNLLATQVWPTLAIGDTTLAADFEAAMTVINEARRITSALEITKPRLIYRNAPFLASQAELVTRLGRLSTVSEVQDGQPRGLRLTEGGFEIWLDIKPDIAQKYLSKLQARWQERSAAIKRLEERLSNQNYLSQAPKEVVDETRAQLQAERSLMEVAGRELSSFETATKDTWV